MRQHAVCIGAVLVCAVATAQAPSTRDLHLRGDRFNPLTWDTMNPAQKAMVEDMLAGERTSVNGPFNVMLRSPEMGNLAQKLGAQLRFHSSLPNRLNEMAILMTARFWTSQYEWASHRRSALAAGLNPAVIDAIAIGKRPDTMPADEEAIYNFSSELLATKQVSDAAFKAVVDKFGERGAVDMTGVMGYYSLVSMMLNVDRYPLETTDKPGLKPLP